MSINKITKHTVKNFLLKKLVEGKAQSTVIHMKNAISGVLSLAVDDEVIQANPAHGIGKKVFPKKDSRPKNRPYSLEELASLLNVIHMGYPVHYPFFRTIAGTGMRLGEALGLKWNDIDLNDRAITIRRGLTKGKESTPKNGLSRKVDIDNELTKILKDLRGKRKIQPIKKELEDDGAWVFVKEDGTPFHESHLRRLYYKAIEKGGLRKIHIHDLRHTYATLRITKGDNLADVSNQLGHHSVAFTTSTYYQWKPGSNKPEVDELGSLVTEKIHTSMG